MASELDDELREIGSVGLGGGFRVWSGGFRVWNGGWRSNWSRGIDIVGMGLLPGGVKYGIVSVVDSGVTAWARLCGTPDRFLRIARIEVSVEPGLDIECVK